MEQIYYTQCPIGYGIGASNGFQVKRITLGYPVSSDFRHFSLRAFPAGGRTLAPASLRYRRVENRAEIALLTPRLYEYETERGLWGRPGGHFSHGLTLSPTELATIDDWPAGLINRPFWRRSDPEPSRGRPPEPLELADLNPACHVNFESMISLGRGLDLDWLALLLTALAAAAREGRTLFLIDEPDVLGTMVYLLTFLFPAPLRAELTFSTYHDRPEELPGYRLHGTTSAARPNRPVLLTQGRIADAKIRTIEPPIKTAPWSIAVVDWLRSGAEVPWLDFARHVAIWDGPGRWEDNSFDNLVAFGREVRSGPGSADWSSMLPLMAWAAKSNLDDKWVASHGPEWWDVTPSEASEGRPELRTLSGWPAIWKGEKAAAWGRAVGHRFSSATPSEIVATALAFAQSAPTDRDRLEFLLAARPALPTGVWTSICRRLRSDHPADSKFLLALAVPEAITSALTGDVKPLLALARGFDRSGASAILLLELAKAEAKNRPIGPIGIGLKSLFGRLQAFQWALSQKEDAIGWLHAFFREHLATPEPDARFQALLDGCPAELRPMLARVIIEVASDEGLPEDVFTEAVDRRLLSLPDTDRPEDGAWPGRYLDRSPSDFALIHRLYARGPRGSTLRIWLKSADQSGRLSEDQRGRLVRVEALARSLKPRDPGPVDSIDLARIPGRDRGEFLARWLDQGRPDPTAILEWCGKSWSDSFSNDSPDLESLALAVAESPLLASTWSDPPTWFHRLTEICRRLDPSMSDSAASGPEGLMACVVASATKGIENAQARWAILAHLLNSEAGWKTIARSLRLDLEAVKTADAPAVVGRWDKGLYQRHPSRFWEVVLNVCDGLRLSMVVQARADDLQSLGSLSWWDHARHPDAIDDLRDAFTRLIPFVPLDEDRLSAVQNWMERPRGYEAAPKGTKPWLSMLGLARWTCLDQLTREIYRKGATDLGRRFSILDWTRDKLPLSGIHEDDRYRLVAWLIFKLDDPSALDIDRVAYWLVKSGLTELDRITAWHKELDGLSDVSAGLLRDRAGLARKLRGEMGRVIADRQS